MSALRSAIVLLAAVNLVGCDRTPTNPLRRMTPPVTMHDQSPREKESVTGHYEFVGINTGNDFSYSFSAIRHADGSVSGEFEERVLDPNGDFLRQTHGDVTCFQIIGNMARIAGILDRVDAPTLPALVPKAAFRFNVVDNGKGDDDPPDLGSNARFGIPATAETFCDHGVAFNLEPIRHGNIVVRQ